MRLRVDHFSRLCAAAVFAVASAGPVWAQESKSAPAAKAEAAKPKRAERAPSETAEMNEAGRRAVALSLLVALAEESRGYGDDVLRARVQARTADTLWGHERERARDLFRRAWDSAEAAEREYAREGGGSFGPRTRGGGVRTGPRPLVRSEVLRLAARRDQALAEEFLARMNPPKDDGAAASASGASSQAAELPPAAASERLRLAGELLERGDASRAAQIAGPALLGVTERGIRFLVELRGKDAAGADSLFAALVARAAADADTDANTVSLLTSYAFTPSIYLTVSPGGIPSSMSYAPRPAPELSPALRESFFRVASAALLRPLPELDQTSAGRGGTYFIAARLLPLFERHAPQLAPAVRAQLAALRTDAPARLQAGDERALDRGMTPAPDDAAEKIAGELEDSLAHAANSDERDRAYAFAAMKAAGAGDARAAEYAEKIDGDTRRGLLRFANYNLVGALIRRGEADEALKAARKGDLPAPVLSWALGRASDLLSKTDRARALELLDESLSVARKIDAGTPERAYSLVAVAARYATLDRARARELTAELIRAANAVENFTGENGNTNVRLEGKFSIQMGTELAAPGDLPSLFAALAEDDLFAAVESARAFSGHAPRSLATVAVARSVLEPKRAQQQAVR